MLLSMLFLLNKNTRKLLDWLFWIIQLLGVNRLERFRWMEQNAIVSIENVPDENVFGGATGAKEM